MFQRLPIPCTKIAQGKASNTSENLLNEIRKQNGTISMNSENSKTPDPHRLLQNLSDKINLKRSDKYVALSNLRIYYTW